MKMLLDFLPLIAFFVAFEARGIYFATSIAIIFSIIVFVVSYKLDGKISKMSLINTALIVVFGSLTIFLKNEWFIKIKPTIVYLVFAAGIFFMEKYKGVNFIKTASQGLGDLSEDILKSLNRSYVYFFIILASLNLVFALTLSTKDWVIFKVWGTITLTLFFALGQAIYITKSHR